MRALGKLTPRLLILITILVVLSGVAAWLHFGPRPSVPPQTDYAASLHTPASPAVPVQLDSLGKNKFPEQLVDPDQQSGIFAKHLLRMIKGFQSELGIDMQIVIANLDETDIGIQAEKIFQLRDIGRQAGTGGILIYIDHGRRLAKLEVSHSLEGILTDSTAGLIAKNQLAPYTAYNAMGMALMDALHYLKDYLYLASIKGQLILDKRYTARPEYVDKTAMLSGGAGAFANIKTMKFDADWKRQLSKAERSAYQASSDPMQSAEAFIRVLKDLIGDPTLELFSVESNIMRAYYPVAPFEYLQRYRALDKSRPLRVIKQGDYAVVTSSNPAHGFAPIMLKRVDKLWRIDTVELWKNIFFDGKGRYYLRNSNTPYLFGLAQFGPGKAMDAAALSIPARRIHETIRLLQSQSSALAHFQLAEIYFRNTFTALAALEHYEQAVRLAPNDPQFAEVLADRYIHLYFPDAAVPLLEKMGWVTLLKLAEAYAMIKDYKKVEQAARKVLEANPYSLYGLHWLAWSLKKQEKKTEYRKIQKQITLLRKDPTERAAFVWLSFSPVEPTFINANTVNVNGTTVYGHSEFSITMSNHSKRDVTIKSLKFYSHGDRRSSGLGDIKNYFNYPGQNNILPAGASITYHKTWGFTVPVPDRNMTYDFALCWQGVDDTKQQCETQRLHLKAEALLQ